MPPSHRERPVIVMRADGSPEIGLGHVVRLLTLARALDELGCLVRFIGAGVPDGPRTWLPDTVRVVDLDRVGGGVGDAAAIIDLRPDLVVVDGVHFTDDFFDLLVTANIPHAVIDDNGEARAKRPRLVLNQNPHADVSMYRRMEGTPTLLLGPGHALIRPDVVNHPRRRTAHSSDAVFVAMGGSDPAQLTPPIIERLAAEGLEIRVALGPAHPARPLVASNLSRVGGATLTDPDQYVDELAACGVAVLAAGSSLWESAYLGVPTIAVIAAANQRLGARAALHAGLICGLHDPSIEPLDALAEMASALLTTQATTHVSRAVDGLGVRRVAEHLLTTTRGGTQPGHLTCSAGP